MSNGTEKGGESTKRNFQVFSDVHDDVEISIDEIEKGLFLGNATSARNLDVLKERNITNILTLDIVPLPECVTQKSHLTTKYIKISDMPKEDLLHVIVECVQFVKSALENGQNILVHCYFGVSRSAAIVIAYIMQKYNVGYGRAFQRVKAKRRFIGPNPGFVTQLKLYRKMRYQIEPQNPYYKTYRLRLASNQVKKAKILPQTCMDVIKSDPGLIQESPEPIVYRCRKCRRIVASKSNLLLHKVQLLIDTEKSDKKNNLTTDKTKINVAPTTTAVLVPLIRANITAPRVEQIAQQIQDNCTIAKAATPDSKPDSVIYCNRMVFVEPMVWMKDIQTQTNGKLNCPKCNTKIGHFNWVGSSVCPCGEQVCPAFYLVPSKVELSNVVQNLQMTV